MDDCVFCKIIKGGINSYSLYEDDLVKAFLDVNPVSKGHILVIPKEHYENIFETPDNVLEKISLVCKKLSLICRDKLKSTGVNILNASGKDAQQSVFHLHYHVVPRYEKDGLDLWFHQEAKGEIDIQNVYDILV
ncbi:HIT family protein [Candidatus Woesearchaeota archaeon]|nr:HIT family protein [Candidatus Woesearchaeota archaeon]